MDRLVLLLCKIKFNGEKFEYFATCETYEYGLNIILAGSNLSVEVAFLYTNLSIMF